MSSEIEYPKLNFRLFGPFSLSWSDGREIKIGQKEKALLVLLLCAPAYRKTRAYLCEKLWNGTDESHHRNLRQALFKIKKEISDNSVFDEKDKKEIRLSEEKWERVGDSADGEFVEGLSIPGTPKLEKWIEEHRREYSKRQTTSQILPPAPSVEPRVSVAILPFRSAALDERANHLGDMLAEEIHRALSRSRLVRVISPLSSRQIDQTTVTIKELRSLFSIDYLVSGKIREVRNEFSLSADFTDLTDESSRVLRDYEGQISDFQTGEAGVAEVIARDVGREILKSSQAVAKARPLHAVEDHHLLLSSIANMHRQDMPSMTRAREELRELIQRAPGCAALHAWMGKWYVLYIGQGWSVNQARDTQLAFDETKRALDLQPECGFSLAVDGFVQANLRRQFDEATYRFDEALEVDPNNALGWLLKGNLHSFKGDGGEAVKCTEWARRLSPIDPHKYFFDTLTATAHLSAKEYQNALKFAQKSLTENRRHTSSLRVQTIAYVYLDRMEEARTSATELLTRQPGLTIEGYLKNHSAAAFDTGREWAWALEKAGVPKK